MGTQAPLTWLDCLGVIAVAAAVPVFVFIVAVLMRCRPALLPALRSRLMLLFLAVGLIAGLLVYITDSMAGEPTIGPRTVAVAVGFTAFLSALAILAKADIRNKSNSPPNASRRSQKEATSTLETGAVTSDAAPNT